MTTQAFRDYNKSEYTKWKDDNTKIFYDDDEPGFKNYGYYIVSLDWMSNWRGFVNGKNGPPGTIDNLGLTKRIKNARNQLR